jgi:hypothetical protein
LGIWDPASIAPTSTNKQPLFTAKRLNNKAQGKRSAALRIAHDLLFTAKRLNKTAQGQRRAALGIAVS